MKRTMKKEIYQVKNEDINQNWLSLDKVKNENELTLDKGSGLLESLLLSYLE